MRLEGRKALVTGGAQGIGAAIARRLAAEGADVVIGDIQTDTAGEVASEIGAEAAHLDVTDVAAAMSVVAEHGPFSVLVNNAGTDDFAFFTDMTEERWRRLLAINLEGVFACTQAVLPAMQEAGYGRIVNIASKGGVISFPKLMARENGRYGITCNAIAPGPIETPLLMAAKEFGEIGERIIETMKTSTQLRRLGQPEEVAAAVAFLASDDASYVTGETLGVSGGLGMV